MVASGGGPSMQGASNPLDLSGVEAQLARNPGAQQALAAAGLTPKEYVAFMGAAMAATMVGQMEAAGMRGFMPPGMTTRPPQENIDFMSANVDIFQRAATPGAPVGGGTQVVANSSDEALPMPAEAGAVLPSSLLARLPRLDTIDDTTDCTLGGMQDTITAEAAKARELEAAYYGNPGNRGLARTRAEGAVLERAEDSAIAMCGSLMDVLPSDALRLAEDERSAAVGKAAEEQMAAWNACPGIAGGKEPACERAVNADAGRKEHEAERRYLAAVARPFADSVAKLEACTKSREAIVLDAKAADVRGANVKDVLRPLVLAWDTVPFITAQWTGICETAQRYLRE
jgi:hypothetical protein